jgi:hypothetical protein
MAARIEMSPAEKIDEAGESPGMTAGTTQNGLDLSI